MSIVFLQCSYLVSLICFMFLRCFYNIMIMIRRWSSYVSLCIISCVCPFSMICFTMCSYDFVMFVFSFFLISILFLYHVYSIVMLILFCLIFMPIGLSYGLSMIVLSCFSYIAIMLLFGIDCMFMMFLFRFPFGFFMCLQYF